MNCDIISCDGQIILPASLTPPTNVVCTFSNGTITATWTAVAGAAKYRVHLYPCAAGGSCSRVDEQCPTTTTYTKSGLTGSVYNIHVRACPSSCPSSTGCSSATISECSTAATLYKCSGTPDWTCDADPTGTQTKTECETACHAATRKWECTDPSTNTCTLTTTGTHGTEAGCKAAADCQGNKINLTTTILIVVVLLLGLVLLGLS